MNKYMSAALDDAEWMLGDIVAEARQWDGRGSDLFILVEAQEHDEFLEAYMSQAMRLFGISSRAAKLLFDVNNPRELSIVINGIEYADISMDVGAYSG